MPTFLKSISPSQHNLNSVLFSLADLETQHRRLADKRRGAMMIEPLPSKKQRGTPTTKSNSKKSSFAQLVNPHKLLTSQQVNKLHNKGAIPPSPKKNVKWEEYLQRQRAGIRSAPTSPGNSPKIKRGTTKTNNFMVNNKLQRSKPQQSPVSPAKPAIVAPIVAVKQAKPKKSIELERFEQYMAKLQERKKPGKQTQRVSPSPTITADITPQQQPTDLSMGTTCNIDGVGGPKVITFTDAKTNRKISVKMEKKGGNETMFPALVSAASGKPQNKLMQVVATATTSTPGPTSASKGTSTSSPKPRARRVYKSASTGAAKTRKVYKTATATAKHENNSQTYFTIESSGKVHTATVTPVNGKGFASDPRKGLQQADIRLQSQQPAVLQTIPYDKWKKSGGTAATKPKTATKKDQSNPTFKLVAANPNGASPPKSLILSGVTGQLKDILTLLSKQQQSQVCVLHDLFTYTELTSLGFLIISFLFNIYYCLQNPPTVKWIWI